ncbi:uncharacterized protein LOC143851442 isoform X2 [Tasmannia lanceolata]|uniref:uncharacterized protein LOC143851442 isoform X2 n=1 Tax=Tasmannia lanceolata TaxID=3420 RepID=UPI004062F0F8
MDSLPSSVNQEAFEEKDPRSDIVKGKQKKRKNEEEHNLLSTVSHGVMEENNPSNTKGAEIHQSRKKKKKTPHAVSLYNLIGPRRVKKWDNWRRLLRKKTHKNRLQSIDSKRKGNDLPLEESPTMDLLENSCLGNTLLAIENNTKMTSGKKRRKKQRCGALTDDYMAQKPLEEDNLGSLHQTPSMALDEETIVSLNHEPSTGNDNMPLVAVKHNGLLDIDSNSKMKSNVKRKPSSSNSLVETVDTDTMKDDNVSNEGSLESVEVNNVTPLLQSKKANQNEKKVCVLPTKDFVQQNGSDSSNLLLEVRCCITGEENIELSSTDCQNEKSSSAGDIIEDGISLDLINKQENPLENAFISPERASIARIRRKLLILDLNGLLVDIVLFPPSTYKPDKKVSGKSVFKRPFCDDFLKFCFERFDIAIWSSRNRHNLNSVIDFLLGDMRHNLLFCWQLIIHDRCGNPNACSKFVNRLEKIPVEELRKVLIPINIDMVHLVLLVLDMGQRTFLLYDSLVACMHSRRVQPLVDYLIQWFRRVKDVDISAFPIDEVTVRPIQDNM